MLPYKCQFFVVTFLYLLNIVWFQVWYILGLKFVITKILHIPTFYPFLFTNNVSTRHVVTFNVLEFFEIALYEKDYLPFIPQNGKNKMHRHKDGVGIYHAHTSTFLHKGIKKRAKESFIGVTTVMKTYANNAYFTTIISIFLNYNVSVGFPC